MNKYLLDHPDDHQLAVCYDYRGTCIKCQDCDRKWHTKYDWVAPWLLGFMVFAPNYDEAIIAWLLPNLTNRLVKYLLELILCMGFTFLVFQLFSLLLLLLLRRAKDLSDHCGKPY